MGNKVKESRNSSANSQYVVIVLFAILYLPSTPILKGISDGNNLSAVMNFNLDPYTLRGIITQFQMFISVYLTLSEKKAGYIVAVILNGYSLVGSVIFLITNASVESLPGVISYIGVIVIISLINKYKRKKAHYLKEIEAQKSILEESEKKLNQMAFYDSLTALPNKDLFKDRLDQEIHKSKRNSHLIGVMFVDLDSFKSVNDTIGHTSGDYVIKETAERLSSCLRKSDTVSRFGGDEFLILISDIEKIEDIHKISNKIIDAFIKPITVQNNEFFISVSAGIAVYPVDGEDSESLIKNADIAMYTAKGNGKNQCVFCSPEMKEDVIMKLKLTNDLYRALDRNELFLYYQPQIQVETEEIIGVEALLRWKNEEFGMVPPADFIPLAEKTGLIKPIGLWVIRTVCEECISCRNYYNRDIRISINLSIEQLKDANFISRVGEIIEETQTDVNNIQIEITESVAFINEPFVLERIYDLKKLGFTISIDDFGTGYSSLSRLKKFPIDLIKIDMEFVHGISTDSQKDKAIIRSIIQISKNLGIKVLAEGVESQEQFSFLKEEKCDEIQGYYFYKPMSSHELKKIMNEKYFNN